MSIVSEESALCFNTILPPKVSPQTLLIIEPSPRQKKLKPDPVILENIYNCLRSSSITDASQTSPTHLATLIWEVQFNMVEGRIISSTVFYWVRFIA